MLGWDGAEPSIIDAMLQEGGLPNLARIISSGAYGRVKSTIPDTSLAAWTSALTGLNPGRHGMVNFVRRPPGQYRLQLLDANDRLVPTVLARAHSEGFSVASFGVPGTWPAEPEVDMGIAGFDSPLSTGAPKRAFHPRAIYDAIKAMGLSWPYGGVDELRMDSNWHKRTHKQLLKNIEIKETILRRLPGQVDLLWVVFSESDTAGHHFWAFTDPDSPRYSQRQDLSQSIRDIYKRLDQALGRLMDSVAPGTSVLLLSDHGFMGASDHAVYINRWLASQGYLKFKNASLTQRLAPLVRDTSSRMVPSFLKELILRTPLGSFALGLDAKARFGALDLRRTKAFCDELPQNPGIWLNVKGREPLGVIEPGLEFERSRDEIAEALLRWRHPHSNRPVVARVLRREDAMSGPAARLAPDLHVDLAHWDGYRLVAASSDHARGPLVRRLDKKEMIGPKGLGTSGAHAPEGICAATGPGLAKGAKIKNARLMDIGPSVLRMLGLEPPGDMDGQAIREIAAAQARPMKTTPGSKPKGELTYEQEQAIRRKLEGLGYL